VLDAFYLSHTAEPVDLPEQEVVDAFLPPRQARYQLDVREPRAFGALVKPDAYMEMRWHLQEAMLGVPAVLEEIEAEWERCCGRRYGVVESYQTENAELVLVTSGTITSTARFVVDQLREGGEAVGLVKVKMFRPFPSAALREAVAGAARVAVLDRNLSPGRGGIFAEELRAALYAGNGFQGPTVYGYVLGLGGRDVTPEVIEDIVRRTWRAEGPEREDLWVGLNL